MDELWGEISKILLFVKAANEAYINIHVYLKCGSYKRYILLTAKFGLYSPSRIMFFCKESSCNPTREGVRLPRPINIKAKAD